MSSVLHPTEGIRLLLERESVAEDKGSAVYRASVYTTSATFEYRGVLSQDGGASLEALGDSASSADFDQLNKIAKSVARAAKRKQDEELPPWPPRVLRWRAPRT